MKLPTSFLLFVVLGLSIQGIHCQDVDTTEEEQGLIGRSITGLLSLIPLDFEDLLLLVLDTGDAASDSDNNGGGPSGGGGKGKDDKDDADSDSESTNAVDELTEGVKFLGCTTDTTCFNDSTQTPGAWTCRPQIVGRVSLCVPTILGVTVGREDDTCGCCEGICPAKCECACTTGRGTSGVLVSFNMLFGLMQFEQCLDPTLTEAATSFTTLDATCSTSCNEQAVDATEAPVAVDP